MAEAESETSRCRASTPVTHPRAVRERLVKATLDGGSTPGADATASPAAAGNGSAPFCHVTSQSAIDLVPHAVLRRRASAPPSTATKVTSARPIISAAAVDAVRLGLRIEFSRESWPPTPPSLWPASRRLPRAAARAETPAARPRGRARCRRSPAAGAGRGLDAEAEETDAETQDRVAIVASATRASGRDLDRGGVEPSRTAGIGDTRVARSAGHEPCEHRDVVPTMRADDDRAGREHRSGLRKVDSDRNEQRVDALPEPEPENRPMMEAKSPITSPSRTTEASIWRRGGAERAQRRELTSALGDGDRQRVEDDERAHEQGDAAEPDQEVLDERDPLVVSAESAAACRRRSAPRRCRTSGSSACDELVGVTPASPHRDGVEAGPASEEACAVGTSKTATSRRRSSRPTEPARYR